MKVGGAERGLPYLATRSGTLPLGLHRGSLLPQARLCMLQPLSVPPPSRLCAAVHSMWLAAPGPGEAAQRRGAPAAPCRARVWRAW